MGLRDRLFKKQDNNSQNNKENDAIKYDVCMVYSTKDSQVANSACHVLEQNGLKCWIAPRNIASGRNYADEIADGIKFSSIIVLIFSKNSMESTYVRSELQLADKWNKPILGFVIDDVVPEGDMKFILEEAHFIPAYPAPENQFETLVGDALLLLDNKAVSLEESSNEVPAKNRNLPKVFISYSTNDKSVADRVCHVLEQNNVKCWIAPRDIASGKNYAEQIISGMKGSDIVVLIFSRYSNDSRFVNNEIQMAFNQKKPIIPFKIDESLPAGDMEFQLKNAQWLDAYPSPEDKFETLVKNVIELPIESDDGESSLKSHKKESTVKNKENPDNPDVYISYDDADIGVAQDICNYLEDNDVSCWIKNRLGAVNIVEKTMEAINSSSLFVLIFSNDSKKSNWVNTEVDLAFSNDIPIVVFQVDDSKLDGGLEFFLNNKYWIDVNPNFGNMLDSLAGTVLNIIAPTKDSQITFSGTSDVFTVGEFIVLSGVLNGDSSVVSEGKVDIYQNAEWIDTVLSSGSGKFSALIPANGAGKFDFKAIFKGNKRYKGCESETVIIKVVDEKTPEQTIDTAKTRPFKAYGGDEPYMFISYKHADTDLILPIIEKFHNRGYNVWFDHGLQYGEDYDDLIDFKIDGSSLFVIFITEKVIEGAYDSDEYMKKELDVAIDTGTKIFPIFIHQVGLKGKYRMQLRGKHSIFLHEYDDEEEFIDDCELAFKEDFGLEPLI